MGTTGSTLAPAKDSGTGGVHRMAKADRAGPVWQQRPMTGRQRMIVSMK
jgi:hypothetical protein